MQLFRLLFTIKMFIGSIVWGCASIGGIVYVVMGAVGVARGEDVDMGERAFMLGLSLAIFAFCYVLYSRMKNVYKYHRHQKQMSKYKAEIRRTTQ